MRPTSLTPSRLGLRGPLADGLTEAKYHRHITQRSVPDRLGQVERVVFCLYVCNIL
jgi:hypothetical protein